MKNILLILLSIIILSSCKKESKPLPNSIKGLKIEKSKLENLKDSLSVLILKVDEKLSELDTIKKLQLVSVMKIEPSNYKHYITIQGNTKTDKNILIRPLASGLITKVYVKEGQKVKKGQLLLQIDDLTLQNSIAEIRTQYKLALTTYQRQKRLWEQKIGSEMQYLQAKSTKNSLLNRILTIKSQLKNYKIRAPFNGVIDDLIANKGDLASPQSPTALIRIVNLSNMYVESDVSENYLGSIKKGNDVIVNFNSIGKEINAKISQVGNNINMDNRSFKVRVNVNNKKGDIKPNLLADIKIKDFESKKAIVIPSNLVQIDEDGKEFVFIATLKDSTNTIATKKLIKSNNSYDNKTLIIGGINLGDLLINEGERNISDKQEVEVLQEEKEETVENQKKKEQEYKDIKQE